MTGGPRQLVLVKHALPVLDPDRPAREWTLGAEGERQARALAGELRRFAPFRLAASSEPKASRTAEIVASELGLVVRLSEALREIDRPALPMMRPDEHAHFNLRLFAEPDRAVIGSESARDAGARFAAAVSSVVSDDESLNHVIVAHGTVIALLVAGDDMAQAGDLWNRLQCPSYVVLELPSMRLLEVVGQLA